MCKGKVKVIPQQAELPQGVPGKLRPCIYLTFGTTRLVGRQPYAPPWYSLSDSISGHMVSSGGATEKNPQ
jgi:hypothetical protein